jgi:hypothetical protein
MKSAESDAPEGIRATRAMPDGENLYTKETVTNARNAMKLAGNWLLIIWTIGGTTLNKGLAKEMAQRFAYLVTKGFTRSMGKETQRLINTMNG